jgi:hypothetical protein
MLRQHRLQNRTRHSAVPSVLVDGVSVPTDLFTGYFYFTYSRATGGCLRRKDSSEVA